MPPPGCKASSRKSSWPGVGAEDTLRPPPAPFCPRSINRPWPVETVSRTASNAPHMKGTHMGTIALVMLIAAIAAAVIGMLNLNTTHIPGPYDAEMLLEDIDG